MRTKKPVEKSAAKEALSEAKKRFCVPSASREQARPQLYGTSYLLVTITLTGQQDSRLKTGLFTVGYIEYVADSEQRSRFFVTRNGRLRNGFNLDFKAASKSQGKCPLSRRRS